MTTRYFVGRRSDERGTEFAAEMPSTFQMAIVALERYIETSEPKDDFEASSALNTIFAINEAFAKVVTAPPSRFDVKIGRCDYFLKLMPNCWEVRLPSASDQ